jgi:hypothetical protein
MNASKLQIHASDYLQATSLTPYQHKQASCPSSSKKKQTRKQRKKRRILPSLQTMNRAREEG